MATTMRIGGSSAGKSQQTEEQLQSECFMWYHNTFRFGVYSKMLHHNDNNSANRVTGSRKKALGVTKGVSDFEFICYRVTHFIEMKIPGGVQSDEQKVFQKQVELMGFPYTLIFSFVEFQNYIYAALATSEREYNNR